jgi:hypothetical protein
MSLNNKMNCWLLSRMTWKTDDDKSKSLKSVISTINKNIETILEVSLRTQIKNFEKIKVAHSSLTPSDLRLCAYLRLNLSSKEIALLNI